MLKPLRQAIPDPEEQFDDPLQFAFASRDADTLALVTHALDCGRARLAFHPIVTAPGLGTVAFY